MYSYTIFKPCVPNRGDTLENWLKSKFIPGRGELIFAHDVGRCIIKIGDGEHTYADCPTVSSFKELSQYGTFVKYPQQTSMELEEDDIQFDDFAEII